MASPTLTSSRRGAIATPAVRVADTQRVRTQLRAQWLVLAAALTVLAGVLVAWAIDRAADRVDVVSIARPVAAGTVIQADDLTTTAIAFDSPVTGLAPASSMSALVGRVATVDLQPGVLLTAGMWADGTGLSAGERTVGALLPAGRYPSGIAQGSTAMAIATLRSDTGSGAGSGAGEGDDVEVRVLDVDADERGALRVTLAVPEAHATGVAMLAAADGLVLIGVPAIVTTDDASNPSASNPSASNLSASNPSALNSGDPTATGEIGAEEPVAP